MHACIETCIEVGKMNKTDFLDTMRQRAAVVAVGPSALRGQGKGVLRATQNVLKTINLATIYRDSEVDFNSWLDEQTDLVLAALRLKKKPWGAARKAVNLFLRDVLYNRYLCQEYGIHEIEPWLEIPLDSAVAKGLKRKAGHGKLPSWPGLKNLSKDVSDNFQEFAKTWAIEAELSRVHLDIYLWLENR